VKNHGNLSEEPKIYSLSKFFHYKLLIHIFLLSIFVVPHGLVINDKF